MLSTSISLEQPFLALDHLFVEDFHRDFGTLFEDFILEVVQHIFDALFVKIFVYLFCFTLFLIACPAVFVVCAVREFILDSRERMSYKVEGTFDSFVKLAVIRVYIFIHGFLDESIIDFRFLLDCTRA